MPSAFTTGSHIDVHALGGRADGILKHEVVARAVGVGKSHLGAVDRDLDIVHPFLGTGGADVVRLAIDISIVAVPPKRDDAGLMPRKSSSESVVGAGDAEGAGVIVGDADGTAFVGAAVGAGDADGVRVVGTAVGASCQRQISTECQVAVAEYQGFAPKYTYRRSEEEPIVS